MRAWTSAGILATLAAGAIAAPAAAGAAPASAPALSLTASPAQVASGQQVILSGRSPAATLAVTLYERPYPYTTSQSVGTTTTGADGSFSFTVTPDRNARYFAAATGISPSATVQVAVTGETVTKVHAVPLGQAQVTIVVLHPRDLHWGDARVQWWFASGPGASFTAAPATRTVRLSPYVVVLRTTVTLPAGPFRWRACFHAPLDKSLLDPHGFVGCTGRGYHGGGALPVGFPGPGAVAGATSYLGQRTGRTAFAVVDSEGRISGVNIHWTFPTASVVKAMLLTAYLRHLDAIGQHTIDSYSASFLYPMIHVSDNNAATTCWSIVGDAGLYSVAAAAGMTDFSVSGLWGTALLSPADQAHFFFIMDSLIPREFVGYARFLLSTIEPSQSWGIPVIARPLGYRTFFKDGSEPTGLGQLVHQVDRLEGHGRTFSIAVMTDGDPTMQYGIDTIQGVAAALLG